MQDFYQHQEVAKSKSWSLILAMSAAVMGTVVITAAIMTATLFASWKYYLENEHQLNSRQSRYTSHNFVFRGDSRHHRSKLPEISFELVLTWFAILTTATGAAVFVVTYAKVQALRRGGGASVARKLGGVLLHSDDSQNPYRGDRDCQRALNVVEEMAIAARLSTPQIFILPGEDGINAFAAGYSTEDAVIALTEGTIRKLSREQLQGVVAHEFAHIVNGDMSLNMEMIGYMHGLLAIAVAGSWLMEMGWHMGHGHYRHRHVGSRRRRGIDALLVVLGLAIRIVGSIGNFFASLIKAAFSRQREFLADAYAVQFTRNAEGIGGALKRIAGHTAGSTVRHSHAVECSHLFFASGCRGLQNLLRSHPPITERILRIDPNWDGQPEFETEAELAQVSGQFEGAMNFISGPATSAGRPDQTKAAPSATDESDEAHLETFDMANREAEHHAAAVQAAVPPVLLELSHESPGAEVLLLGLWFSVETVGQTEQTRLAKLDDSLRHPVQALAEVLHGLGAVERLLLLDSAIETLRGVSDRSLRGFVENCQQLGLTGGTESSFRWAWHHMVKQVVRKRANESTQPRYGSIEPLLTSCEVMLSALCHAGASGPMAAFALQRATAQLGHELTIRDQEDCSLEDLSSALQDLAELSPRCRRDLLLACGAVVSSDQEVDEEEAHLLRGVCASLDYPPARLLPGSPVATGT